MSILSISAEQMYQRFNFHPLERIETIQHWLQHESFSPLILRGVDGVGRHYALQAACYQQAWNKRPFFVCCIDNNALGADIQSTIDHIEQNYAFNKQERSAWKKLLNQIPDNAEIGAVEAYGITVTLNLAAIAKQFVKFTDLFKKQQTKLLSSNSKQQLVDTLGLIAQQYNVVIYLQNMEAHIHDIDLWKDVTQTLDYAAIEEKQHGRVLLSIPLHEYAPFATILKLSKRDITLLDFQPYSLSALKSLLNQRFPNNNFSRDFRKLLMWQGSITEKRQTLFPAQLAEAFLRLQQHNLLQQTEQGWQIDDSVEGRLNIVLGLPLRDYFQECLDTIIDEKNKQIINEYLYLASLCGQWIPQQPLLAAIGIRDVDKQDDILDVIEVALIDIDLPLLEDHAFTHPNFPDIAVYRLSYPLLKIKLRQQLKDGQVQRQKKAKHLLDELRDQLPLHHPTVADLFWHLALQTDHKTQTEWREHLHWHLNPHAMPYFKQWVMDKLVAKQVEPEQLLKQAAKVLISPTAYYYLDAVVESCEYYYEQYNDYPLTDDMASSLNSIGYTYSKLNKYEKALEYYQKSLTIWQTIFSMDHPNIVTSLNNVGITYSELGQYEKSLEYEQKALMIRQKILPVDHPNIATSLNNVGVTYNDLGQYEKALEYKQKALRIRQKILPVDHPNIATSLNSMGIAYSELGQHEKALEYKQKALRIRQKIFPVDHPNIAISLNSMGIAYSELGQHEKALEYHQKALTIRQKVLPEGHPSIENSLKYARKASEKLNKNKHKKAK